MKDFIDWGRLKAKIHNAGDKPKGYDERQIWWCHVGENIGVETDGKGEGYLRPVLIVKKFGYEAFLGVPLTSQKKPDLPFYFRLRTKKKMSWAMFSQVRTYDAARLVRKMEEVDTEIFGEVKRKLSEYLGL